MMKIKTLLLTTVLFSLLVACNKLIDDLSYEATFKRTIEQISSEYKGVVIDKYSTREDMEPTFLKVKTNEDLELEIGAIMAVIRATNIGDSIYKIRNENLVKIKKANGEVLTLHYIKISEEERKDKRFPKEWKNKWLESSE